MYKILVVDDEAIQRRVLGKMIREALPSCEVFEASNGKAALDVIKSKPIDIVFTDIKMPIMDGLDFIENTKKLFTNIYIIILSGFSDFEYAQRAIRLGAYDYLLKPLKEESISRILNKVQISIKQDQTQSFKNEQMKQQLDTTRSVYYKHLLLDWVMHGISEEKFSEIKNYFSFGNTGMVLVSKISNEDFITDSEEHTDQMNRTLLKEIESNIDDLGHSVSFFSKEDKKHMITVLTTDGFPIINAEYMKTRLIDFSRHLSNQYGIHFIIGFGCERENLFNEVGDSYKEALAAVSLSYFLINERVIRYTDISNKIEAIHYNFQKDEEILKESIRTMKSDLIINTVDGLFDRLLEEGFPSLDQWTKSFSHMLYNIAVVIKGFVDENEYNIILIEIEHRLMTCENYMEFKKRLLEIIWELMNIIQNNRSKNHEIVIEKTIQYIEKHYMEDLSMDMVSSRLFFSSSYISMILKNHLGMTFIKYLTFVRINKAIELLESSEMKVFEVASKVGFKDDKYFYRVFKSRYGLTPDEYRRNNYKQNL